jgi:hypothetical protein
MESFEVCYTGGIHIEKRLNELLFDDNKDLFDKIPTVKQSESLPSAILEDIKVISGIINL